MMDLLSEFKEFLQDNLPKAKSFHPYYERALAQMLLAGGKHFRAQLLLGAVDALKPSLVNAAMRVALGVEMLHAYSLIHDDLPAMDNSDLRRGEPTLHVAYDEVTAILIGDALNTQAFLEISRAELPADTRVKCVEILAQNAGASGMVLGQALDCFFETSQKARALRARFAVSERALNLEELTFLHLHKTGKLIAASLQMGAVIAGLSDEKCEQIYKIGLDLGLAFQIEDDVIDATGDESAVGKPTHNDAAKNSFTNLLGVEGAVNAKNELIHKINKDARECEPRLGAMICALARRYLKN